MATKPQELTHDEIWDDSVLVNSWNDALAEYKKYHSIHRKGGNVEDLIKAESTQAEVRERHEGTSDAKNGADAAEDAEDETQQEAQPSGTDPNGGAARPNAAASDHAAFIPAPLLVSVHDENLKKLLMSWYYAGYYTGYYEGQNQGSSSSQQQPPQQK